MMTIRKGSSDGKEDTYILLQMIVFITIIICQYGGCNASFIYFCDLDQFLRDL